MRSRATSPLIGTALLVVLTVLIAGMMGTVLVDAGVDSPSTTTRLSVSADAATGRIVLTHDGGDALNVDTLDVRVQIDGQPLEQQPPIPFFATSGFVSGPTGPLNSATNGVWTAGETGAFQLAGTNAPQLADGARVEITVSTEDAVVARLETTAN